MRMRRGLVIAVMGVVMATPAWASGAPEQEQPTKELLDAQGRVWPSGAPGKRNYQEDHPDVSKLPKPRGPKRWNK